RPGDEVGRRGIASKIGISVAPVHQAVSQLVSEGLLETKARSGTRVRRLDARSTAGFLYVREGLEKQAARLYAGDRLRRHRDELAAAAAEMDREPTGVQYARADADFHRRLVRSTDVPEIVEAFDRIAMLTVLLSVSEMDELTSHVRDSHVELLDRLCEASPGEAERIISAHIRTDKEAFFAMIEEDPAAGAEREEGVRSP
ncbi:MAG: GntR family transcriptional regulator, partial [Phycisphaeraceae bacterium]